ncbi:MAG TPA: RDD family protein [Iamia sp.]
MVEIEEWHPPSEHSMPSGPQSFPRTGVNSLATVGQRALARGLDSILLLTVWSPIFVVVLVIRSGGDAAAAEEMGSTPLDYVLVFGPLVALAVLYETVCITLWGQTLGKLAIGVRVARLVNGRCPLWWESALRIGLPGVVATVPLWGVAPAVALALFTTAGFDPMHRNLVDRAAGTVVVRAR